MAPSGRNAVDGSRRRILRSPAGSPPSARRRPLAGVLESPSRDRGMRVRAIDSTYAPIPPSPVQEDTPVTRRRCAALTSRRAPERVPGGTGSLGSTGSYGRAGAHAARSLRAAAGCTTEDRISRSAHGCPSPSSIRCPRREGSSDSWPRRWRRRDDRDGAFPYARTTAARSVGGGQGPERRPRLHYTARRLLSSQRLACLPSLTVAERVAAVSIRPLETVESS
jgi:hypothetical protein